MRVLWTLACLPLSLTSVRADWPQFRGPGGQGHADAKNLPTSWSETENVAWKVPVPGRGHSSPVIGGDQIWLTTAAEEGRSLRAVCFARGDGRSLHEVSLFHLGELPESHNKNSQASPTPVLDEARVFVHFGSNGTACLDRRTGAVVWKHTAFKYDQPYGAASSPILFQDFLILTCDGTDEQFVVALDKRSGEVAWKTPRAHLEATRANPDKRWPGGRMLMSYSTPLVIDVEGVPQLVSPAAEHVAAYDARTGEEIWWLGYRGFSEVGRPVYAQGVVIINGFEEVAERTLFAIRPDGRGDVSETHLLWKRRRSAPHVPSPLVIGDELYLINDGGIATCLDLKSGAEHWMARIGGNVSASPIYADGKIYVCNEAGKTSVLAPGKKHELIAENELDGRFMASPAVSGRALFLRSESHLYRIEVRRERPRARLIEQRKLGGKGSASQGLALSKEHYYGSNATTICRFDTDWNLLEQRTIKLKGVNHLGAIHYHDGYIWGGFLHGPEGGKHDPRLDRAIVAKIRASDFHVVQTWDLTDHVTWIDPVCFDGTHLWVGDLSDLGIHRYRLVDGELVRDGVFRYPKAMSFSQGIRIVGSRLYTIHTFGSMDGLFEFDIPATLTSAINQPLRVWDIRETRMHLEGFDFVPGQPNRIWHAQGTQVDLYELKRLACHRTRPATSPSSPHPEAVAEPRRRRGTQFPQE